MILPDVNILIYAYNKATPQHSASKAWWEAALLGSEIVALPPEVLFGFVRIYSNPRLGSASTSLTDARSRVEGWLRLPHVRLLSPDTDLFATTMDLCKAAGIRGSRISDAVLAAYAITHRATLYSDDTDFARFPGLDWKNPLLPT